MEKDYYVYIYLNQLKEGDWRFKDHTFECQPFYVGKGKKKREKSHLYPSNLRKKSYKNNTIKKILKETGEEPIHFRIYENLTNEEAIKIEAELIECFGRIDDGTGILTNLTDGGEGVNNFADKNISKPWARKKVYQYELNGEYVREWESIASVDIDGMYSSNISTAIKKNGTFAGYIWSFEKVDRMKPRIKNQMKITYKDIKQIDKKTGELIKIFESALKIEEELNLRSGARNKIYQCLKGNLKTAYGYKWRI